MSGTAGSNQITGQQSSGTAITALKIGPNTPSSGGMTMTAGNQIDVNIGGLSNYSFAPTSGTATYTQLQTTPTINQTGGASGITRSIYVNPTLTSAYDYRAFEATAGKVIMGGNLSSPAWLLNGAQLSVITGTYTDTTSSGTVANVAVNAIAQPGIAASSVTTYSNAATLYIANAPSAGANVTISNAYALWVGSGRTVLGGAVTMSSTVNASSGASGAFTFGAGAVGNNPTMSLRAANYSVEALNISNVGGLAQIGFYNANTLSDARGRIGWNNTNMVVQSVSTPLLFLTDSNERMRIDNSTGYVGVGVSAPSARLSVGGAVSASAWGSAGISLNTLATTFTDTSTAAFSTVATAMINAIATPSIASTFANVTFTDASTLYLAGPPTPGTNVTLSNSYTGYSNSGAWFFGGSTAAPALAGSQSVGDRMVFQNINSSNTGKLAFGSSAVNQFYIQAYGTTGSPRFNIFTTNSTTAPMVSIQQNLMVVGTGANGALSGTSSVFEILANGGSSGLRVGFNNNTTSGFYISDTNASGTYVGNARTSSQLPTASGTANGLIQFNAAVMTFYSDTALTSGSSYTPTRRMSLDRGWWTLGAFASNNLTNYLGTFYTGYTVNATGSGASGYFVTTRNTNSMISATGAYYNSTNMTATETSSAGYWQDAGAHRFFTNTGLTVGNTFGATEQFRIDSTG
jgi:hypothetical protein